MELLLRITDNYKGRRCDTRAGESPRRILKSCPSSVRYRRTYLPYAAKKADGHKQDGPSWSVVE